MIGKPPPDDVRELKAELEKLRVLKRQLEERLVRAENRCDVYQRHLMMLLDVSDETKGADKK